MFVSGIPVVSSVWCRLALERQHIKCQGRTPEATMASALYTDVKRKGNKSVFTRHYLPHLHTLLQHSSFALTVVS